MHFSDLSPAWLTTPFTVSFISASHLLDLIVPPSLPLILPTCPPVTLTSILRTTLSFQPSQQPHVDVKLASGTYMTLCHYLHLSPAPFPSSPAPLMGVPRRTLESSWHIFFSLVSAPLARPFSGTPRCALLCSHQSPPPHFWPEWL